MCRKIILSRAIVILMICIFSCKSYKNKEEKITEVTQWDEVEEDQSLETMQLPTAIHDWIAYYGQVDSTFQPSGFKASGFFLSLSSLPDALPVNDTRLMKYHFFSPDSSRYIDLISYDHFLNGDQLEEGEADQQVALVDRQRNRTKQLLYYGPSQLAESAGWIGNDRFMVATMQQPEGENYMEAEILLIRLDDSTYTNFQLDHRVKITPKLDSLPSFLHHYLKKFSK